MTRWPMRRNCRKKLADPSLGDKVHRATLRTLDKREHLVAELPNWQELRDRARQLKLDALDRHHELRVQFGQQLEARGVQVTLAQTPEEARRKIVDLVMQVGPFVTKSKSMTSEEIGLNEALEHAGAQVTETDLGELIVQLAHQSPSHVTAPAIHLSVEDIARIFEDKLGIEPPDWVRSGVHVEESTRQALAKQLSLAARKVLRERFFGADVGISGANFLVAESGSVVLVENEGNIQLTTCLPRRHIVLAGIEKLIARDQDLGVLLPLLPASATAQRQTCYVSLFSDRHPDMHVVLLDHGRSALMNDPQQRDLLTCIRCGACMNVCPVYRNVGGHAYGGAYPGPIGALLMPHLEGWDKYADLPFASSLCGACSEICPVAIPLHERLLQMRARLVRSGHARNLGLTLKAMTTVMTKASRMQTIESCYGLARPFAPLTPAGRAWTATRDLPPAPPETFRSWFLRERIVDGPKQRPSQQPASPQARSATHARPLCELAAAAPLLLDRFAARFRELGPSGEAEFHHFETAPDAIAFLHNQIAQQQPGSVLIEGDPSQKKDYALGITTASLLIADTGGVVLDIRERTRGRASTLVETHIVIAQRAQLVETLGEVLSSRPQRRAAGEWGDYQVIVTGPSRTADIEKVLVIPAHGPRRLVMVVCEQWVDLGVLRRRD